MKHRFTIGSALLAIVASACCWLPLLLIGLGASAVGIGAAIAPFRPYLLGLATILLAIGFYVSYRPSRTACSADGACAVPRRRWLESLGRGGLWLSALLLLSSMLFPKYGSGLVRVAPAANPVETDALVLEIEGMTCAGCEPAVEAALARVPGVARVEASFDKQQAIVSVSRGSILPRLALSTAVGTLGFQLVSVARAEPSHELPLAGHWVGDVPLGEGRTPTLAMDLDRMGSRWVGEFDVEAFGVLDYPVHVQIAEQHVTLGFSAADAEFQGTLQGDKMSGTIDFDGRKVEVEFRRTGNAVFSAQFLQLEAAADDSTRVQSLSANGEELRARFNADRGMTRLVMLLAPS